MTGTSARSGTCSISLMPSVPGNIRSSRTRRGFSARMRRGSSRGSPVDTTANPAAVSVSRTWSSACGSSSTTRMRVSSRPGRSRRREGDSDTFTSSPALSTVGMVNVNRAPRPSPSLRAQMRPPCASTSPLQMARPRPVARARLPSPAPIRLANRCASRSGAMPLPWSETEIATWTPSCRVLISMGDDA